MDSFAALVPNLHMLLGLGFFRKPWEFCCNEVVVYVISM